MTCIADYPTKKAFRSAVERNPEIVWIHDPSVENSWTKCAADLKRGEIVFITNHPKRSWFAEAGRKADGTLYVK